MNKSLLAGLGILAFALMSGCNNAKSPDTVANDVSAAEQKSSTQVADAQKDAAKDAAVASEKVDDKSKDLNNVEAKGAYEVSMAKAEGDHKVTLEQCNALSGDAQSKCRSQADADYAAAKANAKANEVAQKQ